MAPTAFTTLSFSVWVCMILMEFGIRAEAWAIRSCCQGDNSRHLHFKITFEPSHYNRNLSLFLAFKLIFFDVEKLDKVFVCGC